ncbi:MAG: diphosphate--fructose-6-phosphate 1-phosphotransferase [Terriglobia bacterium]
MPAGNAFISHGGGPTPVLNSSLAGVVEAMRGARLKQFWAGVGGLPGMRGVRAVDLFRAPPATLARAAAQPGSYIRSYRGNITDEDINRFVRFCRRQEIRYCFYSGGNGSMATALRISIAAKEQNHELVVVGIPKTVDNDICETDHSPGFGSAARFVAEAVRDIGLDQRGLPTPVSICEVMGRNTGWLAAASILARYGPDAPPHFIYVPERPFDADEFLGRVERWLSRQGWVVGVVAEGLRDARGRMLSAAGGSSRDAKGRPLAGNCSAALAALVSKRLKVRARSEKPGLLCRAFACCRSKVDAAEAYKTGQAAARAALDGRSGVMVSLQRADSKLYRCQYSFVPLTSVANRERTLDPSYLTPAGISRSYIDYVAPLAGKLAEPPIILL